MSQPKDLAELKGMIAKRQIQVPPKLQRVLEYVLANPSDVAFSNTRNLARNCDVSNSTVVRTAKALGFDDFKKFRELFRRELRQRRALSSRH
jgi:DNA-binding MurR/RpiR family transcriptional regulator